VQHVLTIVERLNVRLKVKRVATKDGLMTSTCNPLLHMGSAPSSVLSTFPLTIRSIPTLTTHHHRPKNPSRKRSQRPPAHCSELWTQYTHLARLSPSSRPTGTYFPHPSHCVPPRLLCFTSYTAHQQLPPSNHPDSSGEMAERSKAPA
jgi:hypothetical protein